MKTLLIHSVFTFCCLFANIVNGYSQVTIGSDLAPVTGALLQLKDSDPATLGGANATKGLGMPRVWLRDATDIKSDIQGVELSQEELHAGLLVYNTNRCFTSFGEGIYVWNGTAWDYLGANKQSPEVFTFTDQEGHPFTARAFGTAGVWMTQNLRVKTYAPGQGGGSVGTLTSSPEYDGVNGGQWGYKNPAWCYPGLGDTSEQSDIPAGASIIISGVDPFYVNHQPEIGYLYNYIAATKRTGIDALGLKDEMQGSAYEQAVGVQGVCPDGWHLPSDREWNELERELATAPQKYSANSGTTWDSQWESGFGVGVYRPIDGSVNGHNVTMSSPCLPTFLQTPTAAVLPGKSFTQTQGGFNVIYSGYANRWNREYGLSAFFWASSFASYDQFPGQSVKPEKGAAARNLRLESPASVVRSAWRTDRLFSVRCKQN